MTDVAGLGAGGLATATPFLESILLIPPLASWGRSFDYRDPPLLMSFDVRIPLPIGESLGGTWIFLEWRRAGDVATGVSRTLFRSHIWGRLTEYRDPEIITRL